MKSNAMTPRSEIATARVLGMFARNYNSYRGVTLALAFIGVTVLLDVENTAQAGEIIYATSFERPKFKVGDKLVGIDGWQGVSSQDLNNAPQLNPLAATITDQLASNGMQSVEVRGKDMAFSGTQTSPYYAVASYRQPNSWDIDANNPIVNVEADLLLETKQKATKGEFFSLTIAARCGTGETLGEVGLSSPPDYPQISHR